MPKKNTSEPPYNKDELYGLTGWPFSEEPTGSPRYERKKTAKGGPGTTSAVGSLLRKGYRAVTGRNPEDPTVNRKRKASMMPREEWGSKYEAAGRHSGKKK